MNAPLLTGVAILLLLVAGSGIWFLMSPKTDENATSEVDASVYTKQQPTVEPTASSDSLLTVSDTNTTSSNILDVGVINKIIQSDTSLANLAEKQNISDTSSAANVVKSSVIKPNQPAKGMTTEKRNELLQALLREIKSLDNDLIDIKLRRSRIPNYISDYFADTTASVLVYNVSDSTETEKQDIESFFNYIVNTSDMEVRDWDINAYESKLESGKVTFLRVKKF